MDKVPQPGANFYRCFVGAGFQTTKIEISLILSSLLEDLDKVAYPVVPAKPNRNFTSSAQIGGSFVL